MAFFLGDLGKYGSVNDVAEFLISRSLDVAVILLVGIGVGLLSYRLMKKLAPRPLVILTAFNFVLVLLAVLFFYHPAKDLVSLGLGVATSAMVVYLLRSRLWRRVPAQSSS